MNELPKGLYYTERELWYRRPEAQAPLARLARTRANERQLRRALEAIRSYVRLEPGETHEQIGQPCGVDTCMVCVIEATADGALRADLEGALDVD